MCDCVVDTSVALKWVITEPDSTLADRVVADVAARGGQLHLLDLALIEAANAIWVYVHRKVMAPAQAQALLLLLRQSSFTTIASEPLLSTAFDLALQFDITVYDALFVAAVQSLGCDGVTADAPLVRKVGSAFPSIKLLQNW